MQQLASRKVASSRAAVTKPQLRVAPIRRSPLVCRANLPQVLADVAAGAPGSVDAPIGVVIGAAAVVTVAVTALIPLALNPGQEAADKIFAAKQKAPLDSKRTTIKKSKK
mmetsp:Transcript_36060/g.80254  ORF Transcript_36060/g.80254 Transcript_36060/m.80254 type:complete len:110 (-) Transcript_36060:802-1131(-)|eukprot:CAMPEP_0202919728 /NCGR_PEP_ID=MMETSP1392-20130828/76486_1 /ASSEMBLY_ACC=CAM_ASM_000868 /TAXON_ID=225041 /ORGANISM="Chlamydomonas chlamydogama, Strain SAG 11-48b" /LENGTH=109 /DNA_ID=CAMNT_0049613187 /DNA_START=145 /DNA_END=474 /DNA_ORIENTATION=+